MNKGLEYKNGEIPPGTLLLEESYQGLNDHPRYKDYLQRDDNPGVWFDRFSIMESWTRNPIISEGFNVCYSLIAIRQASGEVQGIHVSPDPWFPTDMAALRQRVSEWETQKVRLLVVRNTKSHLGKTDGADLKKRFGARFITIDLQSDSRFGLIYDQQEQLLLVQLTDEKLLRVYQGF